jgi:hypothetical protein
MDSSAWKRDAQGTTMATQLQVMAYQDGWDVIYEGARYAESHHATREAAVAAGIAQASHDGATLVTFDNAGRVTSRTPYPQVQCGTVAA